MDDSEKRGRSDFGICAGSDSGTRIGASALLFASEAKSVRVDGRVLSAILAVGCQPSNDMHDAPTKGLAYQHPPASSRLSNTRITSKAFSWARASMAMAPAGPAPITATRFTSGRD